MRWWWLLILSLLLETSVSASSAQERAVATLFPGAAALGAGWVASDAQDADVAPWPAWSRFSGRIYLGPEGARALVGRIEPSGDTAAAMTLASGMFDDYLSRVTVDPVSESRLAGIAPVAGCVAMRRVDGYDAVVPSLSAGISLCQAESGVIMFAYASGEPSDLAGHELSDHLLSLVLAQK